MTVCINTTRSKTAKAFKIIFQPFILKGKIQSLYTESNNTLETILEFIIAA